MVFTIIVFGALMPMVVSLFKTEEENPLAKAQENLEPLMQKKRTTQKKFSLMRRPTNILIALEDANAASYQYYHPNNIDDQVGSFFSEEEEVGFIERHWRNLDENYLKPFLLYNWPICKEDNDTLSKKIKSLFLNYYDMKKASFKIDKENSSSNDEPSKVK